MKIFTAIMLVLFLSGCATTDDAGMLPRSETEASVPWGYNDMCNDPERWSEVHCEETTNDGDN